MLLSMDCFSFSCCSKKFSSINFSFSFCFFAYIVYFLLACDSPANPSSKFLIVLFSDISIPPYIKYFWILFKWILLCNDYKFIIIINFRNVKYKFKNTEKLVLGIGFKGKSYCIWSAVTSNCTTCNRCIDLFKWSMI